MLFYKLVEKIEDNRIDEMVLFIYKEANLDCILFVDGENYYIRRCLYNDILYYVHVKNGSVVKVCIYQEERR